jgi:hypothetical protein
MKATVTPMEATFNSEQETYPIIGYVETQIVTRRGVPIRGGGTDTIGEMVDAQLRSHANQGDECNKLTLSFEPEQWFEIARRYRDS